MRELPADGQLVLALDGIEVLSGSFADEAIGKTLQLLTSGLYDERTLTALAPYAALAEDLSDKLAQRKLALLCYLENTAQWSVLGQLAAPLEETLFLLNDRGTATAKQLADALGISPNVCHNRIRRLVGLRLIREERIDVSAPNTQYRFHAIIG